MKVPSHNCVLNVRPSDHNGANSCSMIKGARKCLSGCEDFYKSKGVAMYECRACDFDLCVRCMKADLYISKFWTEKPWKHSKYGQTYKRKNPVDGAEVEEVEFIASAGENSSAHTDNPQYYERRLENYSVLGKESLHLITVCWMNPWACVEGIKNAKTISVFIYHAYGEEFDMRTTCDISLVDLKNHTGETIDTSKF